MFLRIHNKVVDTFSDRNSSTVLLISLFLLVFLGVLDFVTGDYSLIVFYLIPVSLTAWFVSKRTGLFFCLLVFIARLVADEAASSFSFNRGLLHYWNDGVELVFLLIMSVLFSTLRKNLDSEKNLASTDPLTALLNRRSFFNLAEYELNRSRRYVLPFTIAYIDLDNFKGINDTFGHHIGDDLLIVVADAMQNSIRSTDILSRFGGDEFVLLLPDTSSSAAVKLLKKIKQQLQELMGKNSWNVTFSIGAVTYLTPPKLVDEMIRAADEKMYQVKRSGKNQLLHTEIKETV